MKRIVVLILALLYITASSGVAVSMHYCMGHKAGASLALVNDDQHACKRCGMQKGKKGGCCHDEHKLIKTSDEQTLASKIAFKVVFADAILPSNYCDVRPVTFSRYAVQTVAPIDGPPPLPDLPLFLRNRSLLI